MKIKSLKIKNFRAFKDVEIPFDDYTCLVGPNGAGKSTVLSALNMFFRETSGMSTDLTKPTEEDFHQKDIKNPIEIQVTFVDLSKDAKKELEHYYRDDKLIVSSIATYQETGRAEVKQVGWRSVIPDFSDFFRAVGDNKPAAELKRLYSNIWEKSKYEDISPPSSKAAMIEALRKYESDHSEECELLQSDDQFYGISRGANILGRYMQWVYIPAVKDASTEQSEGRNTALSKILARAVRTKINFDENIQRVKKEAQIQYEQMLGNNRDVLRNIENSLNKKIAEWAHPDASLSLRWSQNLEKSVSIEDPFAQIFPKEGNFEGELPRFGHGLQRSYLMALLQELATGDDSNNPTLILGCEEPELYQHPPQTRHLSSILQKLSNDNSQVIVTTHNPVFVSGHNFENVRMVRRDTDGTYAAVSYMSNEEITEKMAQITEKQKIQPKSTRAKIHQALQPSLNEMFFTQKLILVEGLEDAAYITTYLNLMDKWKDYRRMGCHIVPTNGKGYMLKPLIIAKHMKIPTYVIFDADSDQSHGHNDRRNKHKKNNKELLSLLGKPEENRFPAEPLWGDNFVMWPNDIGSTVKNDIGSENWKAACETTDAQYGQRLEKSTLYIGDVLDKAWENGNKSFNLIKLCNEILRMQS